VDIVRDASYAVEQSSFSLGLFPVGLLCHSERSFLPLPEIASEGCWLHQLQLRGPFCTTLKAKGLLSVCTLKLWALEWSKVNAIFVPRSFGTILSVSDLHQSERWFCVKNHCPKPHPKMGLSQISRFLSHLTLQHSSFEHPPFHVNLHECEQMKQIAHDAPRGAMSCCASQFLVSHFSLFFSEDQWDTDKASHKKTFVRKDRATLTNAMEVACNVMAGALLSSSSRITFSCFYFSSIPLLTVTMSSCSILKSFDVFETGPFVCHVGYHSQQKWRLIQRRCFNAEMGITLCRGMKHCSVRVHGKCCFKGHCLFSEDTCELKKRRWWCWAVLSWRWKGRRQGGCQCTRGGEEWKKHGVLTEKRRQRHLQFKRIEIEEMLYNNSISSKQCCPRHPHDHWWHLCSCRCWCMWRRNRGFGNNHQMSFDCRVQTLISLFTKRPLKNHVNPSLGRHLNPQLMLVRHPLQSVLGFSLRMVWLMQLTTWLNLNSMLSRFD